MERNMTHSEIRDLLGAYALDAVEPEERLAIERHLAQCHECSEEIESHRRSLADKLASEVAAPEGLWPKIHARLEEAPPTFELAGAKRRPRSRLKIAVAFAAATVLVGSLGFRTYDQSRKIDALAVALERESLLRVAAAASADPRAERIELRSPDESATANVVLLPDGTGYLVRHNLRTLPTNRTYQLWALSDGAKISIGVLGINPGVVAFKFASSAQGLAITDEIAGGVEVTRNPPIVVGFRG